MNHPARSAMQRLGLYGAACIITLTLVYLFVSPSIKKQEEKALLSHFQSLLPNASLSAELIKHTQTTTLNNIPVTIYHATDPITHHPLATYIKTATNKGYNGHIGVLIAIAPDHQTLIGIRALEHTETPGLGDKIDIDKSDWVHAFDNQTLHSKKLAVTKDGGDIDAFTGATITPRAVTNLVAEILTAWQKHPLNSPSFLNHEH